MPIFEYVCKHCNTRFEALVRHSDARVNCTKCGSQEVDKTLSTFSASVAGQTTCKEMSTCPGAARGGCGCGCGGRHH